jgi:acyl carrier protein
VASVRSRRQLRTKEKGLTITEEIRRVLGLHARLVVDVADLSEKDDLFRLGMTSHASVSVMLALEDTFEVEFPESMLRRSTFESIGSIAKAITELLETVPGD